MPDHIIDGEVIAEQTTALEPTRPGALVYAGGIEIPLTSEQLEALGSGDDLYIAFYNLNGTLPFGSDFGPEWVKHEGPYWTRHTVEEYHALRRSLPDPDHPFEVARQLAVVKMTAERGRDGSKMLRVRHAFQASAWLTHFAIGGADGVIVAGEFAKPYAIHAGGSFKFGMSVERRRLDGRTDTPGAVAQLPSAGLPEQTMPVVADGDVLPLLEADRKADSERD